MNETAFPKDFLWGAASASAQIEGGWDEGGRTPSIWDMASPKRIKNGEDCHVASDHFNHMKEDVALMKAIGLKSYRFSISWSRVIPSEGVINQEGLRFYSDLIDELKAAQIEPLVTLFHWDLPLWVYKEGGWKSRKVVGLFRDYVKVVVDALSDRVTYWMTINEPQCFIMNGYMAGAHAPFHHDYLALSILTRNCMFAHAEAVKVIRQYSKLPPKVGIAMASGSFVPENEDEASIAEAKRNSMEMGLGLMGNRWWMDPMLAGKPVRAYGVYSSRQKDMEEINQPLDFVGVNVYQPFNIASWGGVSKTSKAGLPRTSMGWLVDERVLYWTLRFVYERYQLPVMVTENGMAENDFVCLDGKVHDPQRTDYIQRYLGSVKRALSEGIPVLGYQYWAVLDNFEWSEGYDPRFGLIFVDYQTGKRTIKDSAYAYKKIIETNGENL